MPSPLSYPLLDVMPERGQAMNRSGVAGSALGAVLLAAALLMRVPSTAPISSSSGQTKQAAPAGQNTAGAGESQAGEQIRSGPWDASRRRFSGIGAEGICVTFAAYKADGQGKAALKQAKPGRASNPQKPGKTERERIWCIPRDEQVRAMIAIVPDPVHSQMSLMYDRSVEALQLAAESVGYVIDRYWLPWETQGARSVSSPASAKDAGDRESQPGLLMFRWNGDSQHNGEAKNDGASVLYVFLVSDTSTAGIHGAQFNNAVKYIDQVCGGPGWRGCGGKSSIRIMGPTFSGSLDSLRRLTEHSNGQSFRVYSGTVSSKQAVDNQHLTIPNPSPCPEGKDCQDPRLVFRSLVTDTETAVASFITTLQDEDQISCADPGHPEVAIFSEAATTYGGAARRSAQAVQRCYANFSYPRDIASLRNAYQQAGRQPPSPDSGNPAPAQNYLPFSLADPQPNRSDEPPIASLKQGPLSQEAVLMKYGTEVRGEHYRYIGIIGSNVLDVLFLSNFLRNACPDVRVFVLNPDLMMERDSDNAPYIGMLALSTYPLIARNLYWTSSSSAAPARLPFADQYEEGQYNAALLAMSEVVPHPSGISLYEVRPPFTQSTEAFDPRSSVLPLWVSVAGTSGFWPVKIIPQGAPGDTPSGQHPQMAGVDFTGAWKAIAALLCAVAFFYVLVLWAALPISSRDLAITAPPCGQRLFFVNLISVNLALCLAMAATPAWRFGLGAGASVQIIAVTASLAIGALFLTSMVLSNVCCSAWREEDTSASRASVILRTGGITLSLWITALLCESLWWSLFNDGPTHYGLFFAYRAVNMASGVSPLAPLLPLFAAFILWSICELWRLRFNDQLRPRLAVSIDFPGALTEATIAASLNRYLLKGNYLLAFVLLWSFWPSYFLSNRVLHLFESPNFIVLYESLFSLIVMLMLSASLRLAQVWADVKKILLGELQRSPIRHSFSRLKAENWSTVWESGGQDAEWLNISRSFEVLRRIKRCSTAFGKALNDKVDQADTARAEILALRNRIILRPAGPAPERDEQGVGSAPKPREFSRILQAKFSVIQISLAGVLSEALNTLNQYWTRYGTGDRGGMTPDDQAPTEEGSRSKTSDEVPYYIRCLEEYTALRYVAFIRGVLVYLRNLLVLIAALNTLALISLNIYSFKPHQSLILAFDAVFILISLTALIVLVQAHRNEILSRFLGTKPNELGVGFYLRVISLGAAPLVTLLATHFPAIGKLFWSIFQPGLEALK